jgi:hypothetical protein
MEAMEARLQEASATDLSRFAWLHMNLQNDEEARQYAEAGLRRDPYNEYCLRLAGHLGIESDYADEKES